MNKIYAGIGSRACPPEKLHECMLYAMKLAILGYTLRSGGAEGCDQGFEVGCTLNYGQKEIYLPWKDFNKNKSPLYDVCDDALKMAERFHPNWKRLTEPVRKLMARNCYQVMGKDLKTPVDFIVCWTENAEVKGGTAQALRIAQEYNIRVYNIADPRQQNGLDSFILWSSVENE
jgi:hypothetical protein